MRGPGLLSDKLGLRSLATMLNRIFRPELLIKLQSSCAMQHSETIVEGGSHVETNLVAIEQ